MINNSYYRMPTLSNEKIVFVSENDLWQVPLEGGNAIRLTTSLGAISSPKYSHDGKWIALVSTEEGNSDVYLMSAEGGPLKRLTYMGGNNSICGWSLDDKFILLSSNAHSPHRTKSIFKVPRQGGELEELHVGNAVHIDYTPNGLTVIGRSRDDNAKWKHYRGGTAGDIIIDSDGSGQFHTLVSLNGNIVLPYFYNNVIVFLSDHEGISNLYSVSLDGNNLQKLTNHTDYYVRSLSVANGNAIYQSGGEIYVLDLKNQNSTPRKVSITLPSMRVQLQRKYVNAEDFLEQVYVSRNYTSLLTIVRGKVFHFGFWEGGIDQLGLLQGVRYKHAVPLSKDLVALISDESDRYTIEIYSLEGKTKKDIINADIGIPFFTKASPDGKLLALTNNRYEIILVNIREKTSKIITKDRFLPSNQANEGKITPINYFDWSPDSKWLTYSKQVNNFSSSIFLYSLENQKEYQVTPTEFFDYKPVFDPKGRYIYFISLREFNSTEDRHYFRHVFVKSSRLCVISLTQNLKPPFIPHPKGLKEIEKGLKDQNKQETPINFQVDIEKIQRRITMVPIQESIYLDVQATNEGLLYITRDITNCPDNEPNSNKPLSVLKFFDLETLEENTIEEKVTRFKLAGDKSTIVMQSEKKLKVFSVQQTKGPDDKSKSGKNDTTPSRKSGWIDLQRIKVLIEPEKEWQQMFRETWRLMRDHYWESTMHGIDWPAVYQKYKVLLPKITTREEYSDLVWEMIAETGTSHSYEMGGDYKKAPNYKQGYLGANYVYNQEKSGYVITKILEGDNWNPDISSPLETPGTNVEVGDVIMAINGSNVSSEVPIGKMLSNHGGQYINISIKNAKTDVSKEIIVKALVSEQELRYRNWVRTKRKLIADLSDNRLGYIHIPDMFVKGVSEFYRAFRNEISKEGLIIDVRFNGGGNTSQLFLEMLQSAQTSNGYIKTRHSDVLGKYFTYSIEGPIVAVTNEFAGSDGDIFSHNFKLLKFGPLIGKRTWGGVVGFWDKFTLVDGSQVSQPEYAFWFKDVAWGVENHGVDPDIEVDYLPQDYANNIDPQLTKAVEIALEKLKTVQIKKPD